MIGKIFRLEGALWKAYRHPEKGNREVNTDLVHLVEVDTAGNIKKYNEQVIDGIAVWTANNKFDVPVKSIKSKQVSQ